MSRGPWASLNVGLGSGDEAAAVLENRRRVAARLGFERLVLPRQVHGRQVLAVGDGAGAPGEGDALVTDRPGLLLGVLGADCVGVLLVDPSARVLAVVHAGWRGTALGVLPAALDALEADFGAEPSRLVVLMGPAICGACYEVGEEVASEVERAVGPRADCVLREAGRRPHLDLKRALVHQLVSRGVPGSAIEDLPRCTHHEKDRFFSHRRDGAHTGRIALVAGWR